MDQFEWSLGAHQIEPEAFAEALTNELDLPVEFR